MSTLKERKFFFLPAPSCAPSCESLDGALGQRHCDGGSDAFPALQSQTASVKGDGVFDDGKTETGAAHFAAAAFVYPEKRSKMRE